MVQKVVLAMINLIFGSMVLLSYYYGVKKFKSMGKDPVQLWGGVPDTLQPYIVAFMFVGAVGYFFFTYNFLFKVSTDKVFLGIFNYSSLHFLYLLVFLPSMIWIGLTIDYIDSSRTTFDWAVIVVVLFTVAIASILLLLFTIDSKAESGSMYMASVTGAALFTFHTLFLDALLWTTFFHKAN
tara:strand:- start:813 stop:1358 length:546 start_codon:yes stop_codon:yes gene_type:complete